MINFNQKLPWTSKCKRMRLEHFFTPVTNLNSKWVKDQCQTRSHTLLEETSGAVSTHSAILQAGFTLSPDSSIRTRAVSLEPHWAITSSQAPEKAVWAPAQLCPSQGSWSGQGRKTRLRLFSTMDLPSGPGLWLERENTGHHQCPRSQQNGNQLRLQTFNKMSTSFRGFHQIPSTLGKVITCLKTTLDTNCNNIFVVVVESLCYVQLFVTPWTVARQAPLSMGFSRQEYWSGLPFPSPGDLPVPGIKPASPALAGSFFIVEPLGKPSNVLGSLLR